MLRIILMLVICCAATIIIEAFPLIVLRERWEWIKASVVCNVVTNPILNSILILCAYFIDNNTAVVLIMVVLEIVVVVIETFFYVRMLDEPFVKCFLVSLLANTVSFLIGLWVMAPLYEAPKIPRIRYDVPFS